MGDRESERVHIGILSHTTRIVYSISIGPANLIDRSRTDIRQQFALHIVGLICQESSMNQHRNETNRHMAWHIFPLMTADVPIACVHSSIAGSERVNRIPNDIPSRARTGPTGTDARDQPSNAPIGIPHRQRRSARRNLRK